MSFETGLHLLQTGWLYLWLFIAVVGVFSLSCLYGIRVRKKLNDQSIEVSSIFITSIFGFFAILIAFQLSGSTNIYENQRKTTIDEAIKISSVIDGAGVLNTTDQTAFLKMLKQYVDLRHDFYTKPIQLSDMHLKAERQKQLGRQLWKAAYDLLPDYDAVHRPLILDLTQRVNAMNQAFDQQYYSLYLQSPQLLWQALIALLIIISIICGYKTGIERGQQFGLTVLFLVVVLGAITICLKLGNPRTSDLNFESVDGHLKNLQSQLRQY